MLKVIKMKKDIKVTPPRKGLQKFVKKFKNLQNKKYR